MIHAIWADPSLARRQCFIMFSSPPTILTLVACSREQATRRRVTRHHDERVSDAHPAVTDAP